MQNHVRPEGLIPGKSGHGTPAETAPRSAAPEAPAPACGFPREKTVCRGFFLPGAHAFPAFCRCRCAPTAYFTPYFSLFPENRPRVRPRTSPAFSPDSLPGTTPALRRCAPAPFSLVFFPFSPAHLPLPPFRPCARPSALPALPFPKPRPLCAASCRRLPFRTACARQIPSPFPARCPGFARRLCGMRPPMRFLPFAVAVVRQLLILLRIFPFSPETGPASCPAHLRAFSPNSLPGTTPALRRCTPAPFSLVFSPAHLPLPPPSGPAPGPSLFRHSLSRSPAPVCGFLQAAPLPHGLRTADPISLFRTLLRIRPEAVRDAARMFSMQDDKELRRTKFLTEKGRLKISRSPHLKKNIKQYAAVYLLDISIRNFPLKHLAILGKISSTSRKTAQPA